MDHVGDLLGKYKPQEPEVATVLKRYIAQEFDAASSVTVKDAVIIITVRSAPLANALRLRTPVLQKTANTTKRFVFRIG